MDYTNTVRKIRLSKLGYYKIKHHEKVLLEWIEYNFFNFKKFQNDEYPNMIFYFNSNNQYIFTYSLNSMSVNINYSNIWKALSFKFNINIDDIYILLKNIMKNIFHYDIDEDDMSINYDSDKIQTFYQLNTSI